MRRDVQPSVPPGHCRLGCGRPIGSTHGEGCRASGPVEPEEVVQLGGLPPLMLSGDDLKSGMLALFVYRLLRDGNPGEIERSAIEAEAAQHHTGMEISNRLLFMYAENIANRMGGGTLTIPTEVREALADLISLARRIGSSYETYGGVDIDAATAEVETWLEGM